MPRAASSERRRPPDRPERAASPDTTRDARLRVIRRIDWRFLLPTPDLGRVAVLGEIDPALEAALTALGPIVRLEADGHPGGDETGFDTVIASGRIERASLATAAAAVATGGRLVLEIGGPLARPLVDERSSGVGSAVRLGRSLAAGGFDPVTTWWTWPSHARATMWVRTDDPIAVRAMLERRLGSRTGPIAGGLAGRLARSASGRRLLGLGAPAITIIATRQGDPTGLIERRLAPVGDRIDTAPSNGLLVLTPRYRASAHVVGIAIDPSDGSVDRVVKVARLADDATLEHEAAILGALGPTLAASGRCPSLIDAPGLPTEIGGGTWPVLVESGVRGSALDPAAVRRGRDDAVHGLVALLAALPVRPAPDRATPVAARLGDALARILTVADPDLRDLVERTARVIAPLDDAALPRVLEHGDPAHPNLLVRPDGTVAAVDWERGESDGLPLHDLTIALAYVAAADRRATIATDQARAFRDAISGPDAWAAAALDRDAIRLGVDTALRPALVVAAFARTVAWLADHLEAGPSGSDDDQDGQDAGSWLVADRSVASWRAALELAETT
jgi:hypothetical protein